MCPATKLANKRNAKLIDLKIKEINSIKAKNGTNLKGIPTAKNILKNSNPCLKKPIPAIPSQTIIAKVKVIFK
jgi:hypothetical protein